MDKCKVCGNETTVNSSNIEPKITCQQCGKYTMRLHYSTEELEEDFKPYANKISSWISEKNIIFNEPFVLIDNDTIERIIAQPDKKMKEKFDSVLKTISQSNDMLTESDFNHCYLQDSELEKIIEKAEERHYINGTSNIGNTYDYEVIYDGIEYLESLEQTNKNSKKIFIACHFTKERKKMFNDFIKPAIEELGYTYDIISSSTTDDDTPISDEIIARIRSAKIVIADFTGQRNSVYYEAGFAKGLGIPVIRTCQKDEVDENKLSFDTRQYPHIAWQDGEDLAKKIKDRIEARY